MSYLKKLYIFDNQLNNQGLVLYCFYWSMLILTINFIVSVPFILFNLFTMDSSENLVSIGLLSNFKIISALLFAPVFESLVLIFTGVVIYVLTGNKVHGVFVSALLMSLLHLVNSIESFVSVFIPFVILSFVYFRYRGKVHAYAQIRVMLIHFFCNASLLSIAYLIKA